MVYDRNLKAVKLWATVHQANNRRKGGVMHINSPDYKPVMLVLDVL